MFRVYTWCEDEHWERTSVECSRGVAWVWPVVPLSDPCDGARPVPRPSCQPQALPWAPLVCGSVVVRMAGWTTSERCPLTSPLTCGPDASRGACAGRQFLDKAKVRAVLINEGITMHRVVFYLAFVVEGRDRLVIAFENLRPRLEVLVEVYR